MTKKGKPTSIDKTDPKKGRFFPCPNCGCRLLINNKCKICSFTRKPKNSTKAEKKTSEDKPQETK